MNFFTDIWKQKSSLPLFRIHFPSHKQSNELFFFCFSLGNVHHPWLGMCARSVRKRTVHNWSHVGGIPMENFRFRSFILYSFWFDYTISFRSELSLCMWQRSRQYCADINWVALFHGIIHNPHTHTNQMDHALGAEFVRFSSHRTCVRPRPPRVSHVITILLGFRKTLTQKFWIIRAPMNSSENVWNNWKWNTILVFWSWSVCAHFVRIDDATGEKNSQFTYFIWFYSRRKQTAQK